MAIIVTCPGCRKSFSVKDEFGGRTGPCPKCKTPIKIPAASAQVKVHGGDAFSDGGQSASGELVLKPIRRREVKFDPVTAVIIGAGALVVFIVAYALGSVWSGSFAAAAVGVLLITPPLVYAPYSFLRNTEEIEGFSKKEILVRVAVGSVIYALFWGAFLYLSRIVIPAFGGEAWGWLILALPFCVVGPLLASALFNLEWGDGVVHFVFYITILLALCYTSGADFVTPAMNAPPRSSAVGDLPPPPPRGG